MQEERSYFATPITRFQHSQPHGQEESHALASIRLAFRLLIPTGLVGDCRRRLMIVRGERKAIHKPAH